MKTYKLFDFFSRKITAFTASPVGFLVAVITVVFWMKSTDVTSYLMLFVIQQSSNLSTKAIQIKLDELIKANEKADNNLQQIEDLTEQEIKEKKQS